ncbi:unnamed protein product [Moneuplotes crassus]|uniref:Uncharacterized protein n=1 Tax=Euplotes crassus TaxID=5936 RepID=A0AAD1U0Z8_EUPCR|nr:unnamed protein product [Moneuplotes crassus]
MLVQNTSSISRNSNLDTDEDKDLSNRKKLKFNILENIKNRENLQSLLDHSFLEKRQRILKNKQTIEKKYSTSLSPVKRPKPKKFSKSSSKNSGVCRDSSGSRLPPITLKGSQRDSFEMSSINDIKSTKKNTLKKKITLRRIEMSASAERKKFDTAIKKNRQIELYNRLKLLDSIGAQGDGQIGPLRMGYKKNLNVSLNPARENVHKYERYLEDQTLLTQSFDNYKPKKRRYNVKNSDDHTPVSVKDSINSFNLQFNNRRATKDYATESTGLTSAEKRTLESKQKIRSLIELKAGKNFTPKNLEADQDIDYFQNDTSDLLININVMDSGQTSSKYSMNTGKVKSKAAISKELLAREIDNLNEGMDPAFHYFSKDFEELAKNKDIAKNSTEWGQSISPNYLLGLKIKQRQKEYWKKRIQRDFSPTKNKKQKESRYDKFSLMQELEKIEERDSSKGKIRMK